MKKVLAILGILSICLVSGLYAAAPVIADLPDLKLFQGEGLSPAFDLTAFNSGDAADSSAIITNFNGLASIVPGSSNTLAGTSATFDVYQGGYGSATVGDNAYLLGNAGGTQTAGSKTKWATYKINKLPKIGLNVGDSYSLNLIAGGYVSPAGVPASFGNDAALIVSDLSKVTAVWTDSSTVTVTQLASATGPVDVDIIAAPSASAPFGADIDMERLEVNSNIQTGASFATAADTASFGYELSQGKSTLVTPGFSASVADANGDSASGVATFTFADVNGGVKASVVAANRPVYSPGWYIARARVFANAGNSHQFQLFNFSNDLLAAPHVDVAANVLFGVPSTWTWVETPLQVFAAGTGIVQYQWKAGAAGSGNIDEIQVIQTTPALFDANRGATRLRYVYGDFDASSDTSGWAQEGYAISGGVTTFPSISVGTSMHLDFSGAGTGSAQKGIKLTANNAVNGSFYTPPATPGAQVGVKASSGLASGSLSSVNDILLLAVYGVSSGQADFFSTGGQLIASAEFGGVAASGQSISDGTHYAIGQAVRSYYQFQVAIKADAAAAVDIDNADFITDSSDNPNYGDGTLFP